jgi:N-acetylmuramoyl-L-alanine amidase
MLAGAWKLVPRGDDEGGPVTAGADVSLPTVVIDAGHGGHDNGAIRNGLREKDLTLDTALRLEKKLRTRGFPVVLTRRGDVFLELTERADVANRIPRALFVSIHFNDNASAVGEGVETFYPSGKTLPGEEGWTLAGLFHCKPEPTPADNGLGLARSVQAAAVGALGVPDRGVKPARYVVIRQTRCAAVLVEGGFLNNPSEARAIGQPAYREKFAGAIADGIEDYQRERMLEAQKPKVAQTR